MDIKTVSLKDYTSLKIGGKADLVVVKSTQELVEVCMYAKKEGRKVHVLGGGTNTFFGESLSNFLCVKIEIQGISFEDRENIVLLTAYAGEVWDDLVFFSTQKNLWGLENLSYIPGTVGAAPVQNIGAYGRELQDVFVSLSALDTTTLNIVEISKEACEFGYRSSLFKKEVGRYIIISVMIELSKIPTPKLTYKPLDTLVGKEGITVEEVRDLVITTRKAKLPDWKEHPNAGSFFKNPVVSKDKGGSLQEIYPSIPLIEVDGDYKIPAAWLIEHVAQMKGVTVGDVGTWPNQPLAIVNYGTASADDVEALARDIRQKIYDKTGISLEQEVNRVG